MNGNKIFIDTNTCIHLLNGYLILSELLQEQVDYTSIITEMGLYTHQSSPSARQILDEFIASVDVVGIDHKVTQQTICFRRGYKLKLPDSIAATSAHINSLPLLTADRSFQRIDGLNIFLYKK